MERKVYLNRPVWRQGGCVPALLGFPLQRKSEAQLGLNRLGAAGTWYLIVSGRAAIEWPAGWLRLMAVRRW